MTTGAWKPLWADDDPQYFGVLHEGVPKWLEASLWEWIFARFNTTVQGQTSASPRFNMKLLRSVERVLKFSTGLEISSATVLQGQYALKAAVLSSGDTREVWRLVDYLLAQSWEKSPAIGQLDVVLLEGGSAWTTGTRQGKPGLEKRVPDGVKIAAETIAANSGDAGARLKEAWHAAFGVDPDPSKAYSLAIKSIEDAVIPVVEPNNTKATLGTSIGKIVSDGDWKMPMLREHSNHPTNEVLVGMLRAVWTGQHDRHGATGLPPVGQEEAEAAVVLAVSIVDLFATGKARRSP